MLHNGLIMSCLKQGRKNRQAPPQKAVFGREVMNEGVPPGLAWRMTSLHGVDVTPLQFKEMFVEYAGWKKSDRGTVVGSACLAGFVAASFR